MKKDPSGKEDWKKFKKKKVTIALYAKKEKICPNSVSKHNSNHEKQVIPLMILNVDKWHYFAVKKKKKRESTFSRAVTSKSHGDFYYLDYLHAFATEKILNCIREYAVTKIFVMQLYFLKTLRY